MSGIGNLVSPNPLKPWRQTLSWLMPKQPTIIKDAPPPGPPGPTDPRTQAARDETELAASQTYGRASTILPSPQGVISPAAVAKKNLLGG